MKAICFLSIYLSIFLIFFSPVALRPPKTLMLSTFKTVQTRTIKLGDFAEICLRTVLIAFFFKICTFSRFTFNELLYHTEFSIIYVAVKMIKAF